MTLMRMPVFVWMTFVTSFLIIFAFPAITAALIFLEFDRLFGTTFYILTGFHGCHVFGGVAYLTCILISGIKGRYLGEDANHVEIVGLYWHFVDLVWLLVFTFVYLL